MANILKRFGDIMSANINALLDRAEDPEKMIDEYLRDIESDLGKVKAETAAVMASETKAKRELDECAQGIAKMQRYAEKALMAGNDNDARQFLEKKAQLTAQQESLKQAYDAAAANAAKMREMHDKLVKDLDNLQAKVAVAKTQEKMNKMGSSIAGAGEAMAAFDRMEEKANRMLDEANAMSQLNDSGDSIDDLARKYDSDDSSSSVDDELAALKAKMGL